MEFLQENAGCLRRKSRNTIKRMRALAKSKRMHAGKAAKKAVMPPPERPEQIERMAICLLTWIGGRPYMRMMQLDPVSRASFRVTRNGAQIPVTCLSEASEILRKRAVSFRRYA